MYIESLDVAYSEERVNLVIELVVIYVFNQKLEEKRKTELIRRKESKQVEVKKNFLEKIYHTILEKMPDDE